MKPVCKYCKSDMEVRAVGGGPLRKTLTVKLCPVCDAPGRTPRRKR